MKLKSKLYKNINNYTEIKANFEKKNRISFNSFPYESILQLDLKKCNIGISLIIPCWNTEDIIYTLKSIELSTFNKKFHLLLEVIIVDDGSDFPVQRLLTNKEFYLNIKLIRQKHLGRAYAINTGVFYASHENIIFCDSDIILSPTTIEQLAIRMPYSKNSILFGFRGDVDRPSTDQDFVKIFNNNPQFYEDNRFTYDFNNSWSTNMMQETNFLQSYNLKNNYWVSDEKTSIDDCWQSYRMVYGFLFTTTKTMFKNLGGFDERLSGWGWDDSIYCARALSQNVTIIPITAAFCSHIKHPYRTKDQWGECEKNFKIVKKNLNAKEILHFDCININRIEKITLLKKGRIPDFQFRYENNIKDLLNSDIFCFKYYYYIGEYKKAINSLTSTDFLTEEELNIYIDCLIRLQDKNKFNCLNKEKCSNCFNYYIGELFFNSNFKINIPKTCSTKNFIYLYKMSCREHNRRGNAFLKQKMLYPALKDFCAGFLLNKRSNRHKIIKIKNILMNNL